MSIDQMREAFAQKITSLEKFQEIVSRFHGGMNLSKGMQRSVAGYFYASSGPFERYINSRNEIGRYDDSAHILQMQVTSQSREHGTINVRAGYSFDERRGVQDTWWWHREQLRQALGVYPERTTTLERLIDTFGYHQYCIHQSTDPKTPLAVAYTPDPVAGMNDKQVKVASLGRLLRKLNILMSDHIIGEIEAMHRSDMDPSFLMARTAEEIEYVYRHMQGDGGCMRYSPSQWGLKIHPSAVYATGVDDMGVAYLRRGNTEDGPIIARTVVWTDRENGKKKFVRCYGDVALKKKLLRNGFEESTLAGARIRRIDHPKVAQSYKGYVRVLAPYLDGVGGNQENYDGTYGYIDAKAPEFIELISKKECSKLNNLFPTMGIPTLKDHREVHAKVPIFDFRPWTCPLSGRTFEFRETASISRSHFVIKAGDVWETQLVLSEELEKLFEADNKAYRVVQAYMEGEGSRFVHAPIDAPTFNYAGSTYLENEQTRNAMGYVKLDPEFYPGEQWAMRTEVSFLEDENGRVIEEPMRAIRQEDRGYVLRKYESGAVRFRGVCKQLVFMDLARLKEYLHSGQFVQTVKFKGIRCVAHVSCPGLVTLTSGRRAISSMHDVVQLVDGRWATPRMAQALSYLGGTIFVQAGKKDEIDHIRAVRRVWESHGLMTPAHNAKGYVTDYCATNTPMEVVVEGASGRIVSHASYLYDCHVDNVHVTWATAEDGTLIPARQEWSSSRQNFVEFRENAAKLKASIEAGLVTDPKVLFALKALLALNDIVDQTIADIPRLRYQSHEEHGQITAEEHAQAAERLGFTIQNEEESTDESPTLGATAEDELEEALLDDE